MPRRGGSPRMSAPKRSFGTSAPARRPAPSAVAHPPPAQPMPAQAQPRQPGMFAQMATTAAGVAVGSAVGHTIAGSMMGGGGRDSEPQAAPQYEPQSTQQQAYGGACAMQLKQFLECAQGQSDISLCYGFNEALKECKMASGLQ